MMEQGNGKIFRPPVPGYTALEGVLGLELNQLPVQQRRRRGRPEADERTLQERARPQFHAAL